jgi:hypothetical protein
MAFKEYPPRQKAASFAVDQALEMLQKGAWWALIHTE